MNNLRYERVDPKDKGQLLSDLESGVPKQIASALYSASRHESDWAWVQDQCLRFVSHASADVRWAAVTCLGDLAFSRHLLNTALVIPALERAVSDTSIADPAAFSLSMVKQFCIRG